MISWQINYTRQTVDLDRGMTIWGIEHIFQAENSGAAKKVAKRFKKREQKNGKCVFHGLYQIGEDRALTFISKV